VLEDEPHIGVTEFRVRHDAREVDGHLREYLTRLLARLQVVLVDVPGRRSVRLVVPLAPVSGDVGPVGEEARRRAG
jgi:hypothetical protein